MNNLGTGNPDKLGTNLDASKPGISQPRTGKLGTGN